MKLARFGATAAVSLLATVCLSNCSEKNYINQPITDSVHIHGTVRAWRCSVGDWFNNPRDPEQLRFSVNTGESATVTFIRDNGFTSAVETDTASEYDIYLSAGSHKIVVETGYTYPPDTIHNVQLRPGDTTIVLDITYTVLDPWNIECMFGYHSIDDTASVRAEWDAIWELNQRSFGHKGGVPVFDIARGGPPSDSRRLLTSEYTQRVYADYTLPVIREYPGFGRIYNVYEAYLVLQHILDSDTTGSFPDNFSIYPTGIYGCLAKQ